ncbi:MAG: glucose-1-phosphate thymidylyltransferase RfbA [Candidatus Omnitrophota bacterium]|nr:glucose-1-phosphate thymidylyltransferase RfbA [Candidatus Omnitrophota bacterium]MBU1929665.1 glucose-1-phosphate thymidylyltransferase RfbA [Candidatus Omnitrophota bacterium]MBU2035079.1 glucose-1-phosphate thymidylyltransferase RfbA [Candidatus Omnitrophota bacterium]MBU2221941.1 glucose-1-phosphate thymidylyltransferase RfbA [Candidatus Omnitrophota bacterium]
MKGIILAGGKATRLYPITKVTCKQLLPVYDKPMVYYPLSVLMLAKIRDILLISTPEDIPRFKDLLGDGGSLGIKLSYAIQKQPKGIAQSLIIGEKFIGSDNVALILGDNIFYGHNLTEFLDEAAALNNGALVFGCYVKDPQRYGVIEFDNKRKVISIEEKPKRPKSKWAVTGLYFYDNQAVKIARKIKPSKRGELEITDVNNAYIKNKNLKVKLLGRGYSWLDTGTYDSLVEASMFIKTIEERQGLKIGCIEEIAYRSGFINRKQLAKLAGNINTSYGGYLKDILKDE